MGRRSVSVAEVLKAALPPARRKRIFSLGLIRAKWVGVVGRELAVRSEPTSLGDRLLTVLVADAAWGRMILKLQRDIVSRINRMVEPDLVRRLQFIRDGRQPWGSSPPESAPVAGKPAVVEPSALILEAAKAIENPALQVRVARTAARYLAAQERGRKQSDSNQNSIE